MPGLFRIKRVMPGCIRIDDISSGKFRTDHVRPVYVRLGKLNSG
jgi:hypothetical protein